jgi:MFS family permease
MKPVLPTIGAATLCVICGTAASALYFGLIALLCRLISSGFAAGTNSSATWWLAAQFGLTLGLAAGLVCSGVLALIACWSADLPAMRKKFASQFMLMLLAGAVLAAAAGTYAQWDSSHGGAFVAGLAGRQGIGKQTALANLIFSGAAIGVMSAVALCMLGPWIVPRTVVPTLRDLLLPFNVAKYMFIGAVVIGTIWGLYLPSSGLLQATYKLGFGAVMWGVATLYLCDFVVALAGRSSPYWQKFYDDNKTDLYVCGITGLTLVLLVTLSSERYSWYSLDLALLGLPFFLYAIFAIHECATIKVAGRKLPLR